MPSLRFQVTPITQSGSPSPIQLVPYDKAYDPGFEDMPRRVPDLTKIRALIGYEPQVGLDEIIERVVAEARRQREPAVPAR